MNNVTELVFILDKSGSMAGMEKDTIGGFNAMIEEQKQLEGTVYVSTLLFANETQVLHDRKNLEQISPLTQKDYRVGGCTALLDAIGGAIKHVANIHKYARQEDVPQRTIFVITTDGMENASRYFSSQQVKQLIENQKSKFGWEFLFVADNIDAVETAERIGISKERATNYSVQEETEDMFKEMNNTISAFRKTGAVPQDWSKNLNKKNKN